MNQSKPWYLSKTIWAGIAGIVLAAWGEAAHAFPVVPDIPEFLYGILAAVGIGGRLAANSTIRGK